MLGKIEKVLKKHNLKYYVPEDGEGNITLCCPFCNSDRQVFGIHIDTGKWNCFKCESRGLKLSKLDNYLDKLKKGEIEERKPKPKKDSPKSNIKIKRTEKDILRFQKDLLKNDEAKRTRYHLIKERGFSSKAIKYFKLGYLEKFNSGYFSIPTFEKDKLVNIKYRTSEPAPEDSKEFKKWKRLKWLREKGGKSGLFHSDPLDDESCKEVIIVEAECDAIALWDAGFKNVVSVTVGAKGFKTEWYDKFSNVEKIYICFDNDAAGHKGSENMAQRLGFNRCHIVELPDDVNDINDFFWNSNQQCENYNADEFRDLLKKAKKISIDEVTSLDDVLRSVELDIVNGDEYDTHYITPPWSRIAQKWGGPMFGHLIIIAALPKCGKTSLMLNWSYHLMLSGLPVFFICCEMRDKALAKKIVAVNRNDYMSDELLTQEQIRATRVALPSNDMHFWYPSLDALRDFKKIEKKIRMVVERHGCRVIVFDNIQFAARDENGNTSEKTGQLSRMFKALAEELNCLFFAISQPRKTNGKKEMNEQDLKDSSSILQDLDHLLILNSIGEEEDPLDSEDDFEDDDKVFDDSLTKLRSVKIISRWFETSKHLLYFNGKRSIFKDSGRMLDRLSIKRKEER